MISFVEWFFGNWQGLLVGGVGTLLIVILTNAIRAARMRGSLPQVPVNVPKGRVEAELKPTPAIPEPQPAPPDDFIRRVVEERRLADERRLSDEELRQEVDQLGHQMRRQLEKRQRVRRDDKKGSS
jgi:hypothetical protein